MNERVVYVMCSTSQKHRNFVSEPMGNKPVTALAGIGSALGQRLINAGFYSAKSVLGQYLIMHGDERMFRAWLKAICNANVKQSGDCWLCLKEWCDAFL